MESEEATMGHLPPPPIDLTAHSPSSELPESSSLTRMEVDGLEKNVEESVELFKKYVPCLKMEFETEEAAFDFYNEYGRISGFSVRKSYGTNSRKDENVMERMGVMEIPESYVLRRWRLNAKDCELEDKSRVDENDPKLLKAARFRIICPKMVKLATWSCELQEAYEYVEENLKHMCAKVAEMLLGVEVGGSNEIETKELEMVDPKFAQVKGLKKKNRPQIKGRRRLKAWHDKSTKRKKVVSQSSCLSENIDHVAASTIVHGSFFAEPPEVEIPYVPQMMNYEEICRSIPSSSQASYDPQTFKEMPFGLTSHSSSGTNSLLDEDSFLEMLRYPGYPKQN